MEIYRKNKQQPGASVVFAGKPKANHHKMPQGSKQCSSFGSIQGDQAFAFPLCLFKNLIFVHVCRAHTHTIAKCQITLNFKHKRF